MWPIASGYTYHVPCLTPTPNPDPNHTNQAIKDEERLAALSASRNSRLSARPTRGAGAKAPPPSLVQPEGKADIIIDYGGLPDALVRGLVRVRVGVGVRVRVGVRIRVRVS